MHRVWQKKKKFFIPFFYLPECDPKEKKKITQKKRTQSQTLADRRLAGWFSLCVCVCVEQREEKKLFLKHHDSMSKKEKKRRIQNQE